jgi:molybdate transport repressor ModE-like protein
MTTSSLPAATWSGIEHRHLASLAAVARARSFRGAARELGCSQSALSQHIAQLERLLGVRILERQRGSADVGLTDAGTVLLRHVEPILGVYRAAQADLAALSTSRTTLRLGVADHLVADVVGRVVPEFLRTHRGAEIEIREGVDGGTLAAAVAAGDLDLSVGDPPEEPASLATQVLAPEPYILIAPASWAVVRRAATEPLQLLSHLPLVRPESDPDAARVERELRARGVIAGPAITTASPTSMLALVAAGTGAAVVPAGRAVDDPRFVRLSLDGLVAPRNVIAAWPRERRAAPLVGGFVAAAAALRPLVAAGAGLPFVAAVA